MIIGFGTKLQTIAIIYIISSFLFGFVPGFYLPLILMLKMKKLEISSIFWKDFASILNNFIHFFLYYLPVIVGLEIVIVIFHFFFIFRRKNKR